MQLNPTIDISFSDCADAFQNISRHQIQQQTQSTIPELAAFQFQRLSTTQQVVYFGPPDGPEVIPVREGISQGGCRSLVDHGLGTLAHNRALRTIVANDGGYCAAYADDVFTAGSESSITESIRFQIEEGPKVGQKLRLEKHKILIGARADQQSLHSAIRSYSDLGIPPQCIRTHPTNSPDLLTSFGHVYLGVPIGAPEYVVAAIDSVIADLETQFQKISEACADEKQMLFYFLANILPHKLTYLLRTLEPQHSARLADRYSELQRQTLCYILDLPSISDAAYTLACSPSGAGLP